MKIRRSIKRSTRQYIMVAIICTFVIGGAAIFTAVMITSQIRQEYQTLLDEANQKISENQREVYVTKEEIKAGEFITKENVEKKIVFASQPKEFYLTKKGLGKTAIVNIPIGVQVINSMLTENKVSSELRESEFNVINLSSNIVSNDIVDIRICYPNGEDYIILTKKALLHKSKKNTNCYFWLSEEEIVRMSSAIVDAYLYKGSRIYTTKYIEPSLQKASIVNYTPSLSTINLIKNNPNIVQIASKYLSSIIRKELENRIADSLNQDITKTQWQTQNNQTQDEVKDTVTNEEAQTTKEDNNFYYEDEERDKEADQEYGE